MEPKFIIAIVILSVGLLAGIFVLAGQNGGIGAIGANLSQAISGTGGQWVRIQPRTAVPAASEETTSGDPAAQIGTNTTTTGGKTKKAAVAWCDPAGAVNDPAGAVIIGEVAWMGTAASYADEWIELENLSSASIDLSGWQLQNKNQKLKISFSSGDIVSARGVYLLERTGDDTVPGVAAAKIYTGSLANSNEALYLFDADCKLQDMTAGLPGWPAGNNNTKQTMERLSDLNWTSSAVAGGTPGKK